MGSLRKSKHKRRCGKGEEESGRVLQDMLQGTGLDPEAEKIKYFNRMKNEGG